MKKRRLILFFCVWILSMVRVSAQFDAIYSNYMELPETNNAGAVAQNEMMNLIGAYRLQWAGFSDAPVDMFFSVNMPFSVSDTKHGVGLVFSSENIGLFKDQSVLLQYSYKMRFWKGVVGLGLNVGFLSQTFDFSGADFSGNGSSPIDGDEYHKQDPYSSSSSSDEDNALTFDAGVGAYYSDDEMFVGLSVAHLNSGTTDFGTDSVEMYVPRIFYLSGGYNIPQRNAFYVLKPSTQIRTDFSDFQMDLTCVLEYDKKIRGGLTYRLGDAFVFLVGMDLFSGLRLGYSYDLPISRMISSGGSHEICLRYSFKPEFSKKNKYKSDRIL